MQNSFKERFVKIADDGLKTLFTPAVATRQTPAATHSEAELSVAEKMEVARLMRVNHCGEVCAQALYQGQALFARDEQVRTSMQEAADEEIDHLAWTAERIDEMGGRQSLLNPLWYGGSFAIGAAAALLSDKISLGFVAETERQVSTHLNSHLQKLPAQDEKSRAIVQQMDIDEQQHATHAVEMGGVDLPAPVKGVMHLLGKVMTKTSYWV
ncbi:MAG: 2-polyprenyl-3-methyl-6-methoxy-1,4-benzoquinone monooxygenase [Proteobacteria bacterium]|nr:2-polyprenyl-3-methyl-6-methoxy-1,4-benzoquinone monooxygenase [Pseudomonadota bacterium]